MNPGADKSRGRSLYLGGVELEREGFSLETLDVGDGCEDEMTAGETDRMHRRTGKLYGSDCGAVVSEEERIAG